VKSAAKNITHVFHLASPASPPHYQRLALETMWANTVGLEKCIEFADRQGARVVFASTSEIYGDPQVSPQPEDYWGSVNSFGHRSCYDESKRFGESLIFSHNRKQDTWHGLVRIFNTYGPRMDLNDGRVIITYLDHAHRGLKIPIYGHGTQTRSFCYVTDLVRALMLYAEKGLRLPINIGNDREFTMLELVDKIQNIFPQQKLEKSFKELPADDPKQRRPDLTRAKDLLSPWKPEVPLEEGLLKTLLWIQERPS